MCVAHTFEVVQQETVASVVHMGEVYPARCCLVNSSPDQKPRTYLHLWGRVKFFFLCLITPAMYLRRGGGACCWLVCC